MSRRASSSNIFVDLACLFCLLASCSILAPGSAEAQSENIAGYRVTYQGRSYDAGSNRTTFSYLVEGENPPLKVDLDDFVVGFPERCPGSGNLQVSTTTPAGGSVVGFFALPILDFTWNYVRFENDLDHDESRSYTITFAGNIEPGTVPVKVRNKFLAQTQSANLPGASCVRNTLPVCNTGGPYTSLDCGSNPLTFQISQSSSDADAGDTLTYQWSTDCLDGAFSSSSDENPSLTYTPFDGSKVPVSCTVTLVVSDGTDSAQCSAAVGAANCKFDCNGVFNGPAEVDVCGVCGGDGNSCRDCAGIPFGDTEIDACGVCGGTGLSCAGCDGVPNSGTVFDACNLCGGDGTSCAGCDGVPNSGMVVDECGVCGGNGSSCAGCDGVPNSGTVLDACGVCGGDGSSCAGCDGESNSGKTLDACGICDGDGSSCAGCDGVANSGKIVDKCNVCGGSDECLDCNGEAFGTASVDRCGVCGGDGVSCLGCQSVNIFSTQITLDGTLNQQRGLVLEAASKLRKVARNNKSAKKLARKLLAEAQSVYADSWRLVYDFPQIQTTCANSQFCAQLDQSSLIEKVNRNAMRLREIVELLVKRKKAIKKERRSPLSDHKLVERARRLEITTLKTTDTISRTFSSCS